MFGSYPQALAACWLAYMERSTVAAPMAQTARVSDCIRSRCAARSLAGRNSELRYGAFIRLLASLFLLLWAILLAILWAAPSAVSSRTFGSSHDARSAAS